MCIMRRPASRGDSPEEVDLSALVTRLIRGMGAPVHDSRVAQALSSAPGFRALDDGAHS
jgi:hypothetical protein